MNNKLSITHLILIIASFFFGCSGSVEEEYKDNALANSVAREHTGNEKYAIIDAKESVVTWKGSSAMGAHTGFVSISKGKLMIEKSQLVSGTVEVDMNTIQDEIHGSDNNLIKHLKDPDFFDVKKFPISTIVITEVASINGENKKVTGNLTIKGITHAVSFPATMEIKDGIFKANGRLVIDRTKWDVRYNSGKFYDNLADKTISDSIEFIMKIVAKQDKDSLTQASLLKTEISKERETGEIYQSISSHHNIVHQFTYLAAMRDFCNKTLLEMRANGEVNKKLSKELKRELLNAKAALTSSKFNGLKIELGLYEIFMKQINDRFTNRC